MAHSKLSERDHVTHKAIFAENALDGFFEKGALLKWPG
jgi:hypothetical protein